MPEVYLSYNTIVSAYGFDSHAAISQISNAISSLKLINDKSILPDPFYSSQIDRKSLDDNFKRLNAKEKYTTLEKTLITSLSITIKNANIQLNDRVGLIISTTKGNIDVLEKYSEFPENRAYLSVLGKKIMNFFGFKNEAIILSNACVSGVLATAMAKRFINQGTYDHVFIAAGDLVSEFILTGFQSFQALSKEPCRPYCKTRSGINIGEVGASILVTKEKKHLNKEAVKIVSEASCNDANHISGPSRTGEGLYRSINSALNQANFTADKIDYISAHGTATNFNDEMESIAFNRAGLQNTPLNSFKGYFGHTLGASGLLETIIGMHSLQQNTLFSSLGFKELGVSKPLNIITKTKSQKLNTFLKTASGFGGCNTAVIFEKINH
ncbi:beta-ketoacyl synthase [Kriegella sp. EG-1]|nr:beta-ketoacyl synthase [Flavobacteriaceae bacterium EG-1]